MLKNKKGISLTTMVITVLILVIILSTLVYTAYTSVKVRNLNKLYNDLRTLSDEVIVYYAENKTIPADLTTPYETVDSTTDTTLLSIITTDGTFSQNTLVNPNDYDETAKTATYYTLDLDLLSGISLSYTGTYIINAQSLMIYYVDGVTVDDETYYSLPLSYMDTDYGKKYPVTSITTKTIYLPINETQTTVSVSDYYTLVNSSKGTPIAKTITYNITDALSSYDSYFSFDSSKGEITTKIPGSSTALSSSYFSLTVTASNYDSTSKTGTIKIYLVDIGLYSDEGCTTEISSLTMKKGEETTIYAKLLGYYSDSSHKVALTTSDSIISTSAGTLSSGISAITISATSTGTTTLTATQNTNDSAVLSASTSLAVNVLNPTLVDEDSNTVSTVKFTSLNDTETLTLQVDGIDDSGLTVESVAWTYKDSSEADASEYLTAEYTKSTSNIVLTPKEFGTVYLSGTVTLSDGSTVDLDSITVSILGVKIIGDTGNEDVLTMEAGSEITLADIIEIATDLGSTTLSWTVASDGDGDPVVTLVKDSETEKIITMKAGDTAGTSTITASITTTDGIVYSDTCTVTVTETASE